MILVEVGTADNLYFCKIVPDGGSVKLVFFFNISIVAGVVVFLA